MYYKSIADPLKEIRNSVTQYLNRQAQIEKFVTQYMKQQTEITHYLNRQTQIVNSVAKLVSELPTKPIIPTFSSLNCPYVIIPPPIDNSIIPLVPEEHRTPSQDSDSITFTDEVNEKRIPLDERSTPSPQPAPIESSQRVLIVGGCSDGTNQKVARFIKQLGFEALIVSEQPNGRRTRFEKFKAYTNVNFAIVLLTPDDVGRTKDNPYDKLEPRPSQDTILGLGYLFNQLCPEQMCTLYTENIELPSLLEGYIHLSVCISDGWKLKLIKEMKFAGLRIDGNKLLGT